MLYALINKLDKYICNYLGLLGNEVDRPQSIKMINNDIFILKNIPFQRHKAIESWKQFNEYGVHQESSICREKIGLAAGKVIAKNLIISFDPVEMKKINEP